MHDLCKATEGSGALEATAGSDGSLEVTTGGGSALEGDHGRRWCSGGGGAQRERRVRELILGEVRVRVIDPCGRGARGMRRGAEFWASLALPTFEARIELLYRAGLRVFFYARWAVPRCA
jgi:hypothetical protein